MCRRPIYFKGFRKVREQWDEDAWEIRCSEVLSEAMDECIADGLEMADYFPKRFKSDVLEDTIEDLRDLERTFRYLKSRDFCSEDIEYVLNETNDYYSDRHMNKDLWLDEPPKEWITRYPDQGGSQRCGKRARAFTDDWVTLNLVVLI
jgi:chlorite dismutase